MGLCDDGCSGARPFEVRRARLLAVVMFTQSYGKSLLALLFTAAYLVVAPSAADAWCQSCSVTRGNITDCSQPCECRVDDGELLLAWNRPCLSYSINEGGADDLTREQVSEVLERSFSQWENIRCGLEPLGFQIRETTEPAMCSNAEFVPDGGNANVVAFVGDWDERDLARSAFAITTQWFGGRSGEIFGADILVNEEFWDWTVCPDGGCPGTDRVDFENTMTHEAGHFLGLGHSSVLTSTMSACALPGDTDKRELDADDIEGMCSIYPPSALTRACDFDPPGGFDPTCEAIRPDCGCSVGSAPPEGSFVTLLLAAFALQVRRRKRAKAPPTPTA